MSASFLSIKFVSVFLGFCLLIGLFIKTWVLTLPQLPLDADEVVWVHDAQVWEWRTNGEWHRFQLAPESESLAWDSPTFRLLDQPHLVKYVLGWSLNRSHLQPWQSDKHRANYQLFAAQAIPRWQLDRPELSQLLGSETVKAIQVSRWLTTVMGGTFLGFLFLWLGGRVNWGVSFLVTGSLMLNPVLLHNLRLANADSLSLLCFLIAIILLWESAPGQSNTRRWWITLSLSAVMSALAATAKINGWLLVPIAVGALLWPSWVEQLEFEVRFFIKPVMALLIWSLIFGSVYIFLQPEIWWHGGEAISRFLTQRQLQQARFINAFGTLNIIEYHRWLLVLFFSGWPVQSILLKIIIIAGAVSGWIIHGWSRKISPKLWLGSFIFLGLWVGIYSYARVGFERYAIGAQILLAIVVIMGWGHWWQWVKAGWRPTSIAMPTKLSKV